MIADPGVLIPAGWRAEVAAHPGPCFRLGYLSPLRIRVF